MWSDWLIIFVFAFSATCFSWRELRSFCWTPVMLEQTLTLLFRQFLFFTDSSLYQQIKKNDWKTFVERKVMKDCFTDIQRIKIPRWMNPFLTLFQTSAVNHTQCQDTWNPQFKHLIVNSAFGVSLICLKSMISLSAWFWTHSDARSYQHTTPQ